jgi:hypothetical protein
MVIKMDPADRGLVGGVFDGLEGVVAQTFSDPRKKISGGVLPPDFKVTDADRVG